MPTASEDVQTALSEVFGNRFSGSAPAPAPVTSESAIPPAVSIPSAQEDVVAAIQELFPNGPPQTQPAPRSLASRLFDIAPTVLRDFTVGPFIEAGKVLKGSRPEEAQDALARLSPDERAVLLESGRLQRPITALSNEELVSLGAPLTNLALIGALGERGGVGRVPSGFTRGFFTPTRPRSATAVAAPVPEPTAPAVAATLAEPTTPAIVVPRITETQRTLEAAKAFEEKGQAVRDVADRVRSLEKAGLPVPKFFRREEALARQSFADLIPEARRLGVPQKAQEIMQARLDRATDLMRAGGIPDFIEQQGLTLKNEANRPVLNLLAQLESSGDANIGLVRDGGQTSLGPFQLSAAIRREFGLKEKAGLQEQAQAAERVVTRIRRAVGDDILTIQSAYNQPANTAKLLREAKKTGGITQPTLQTTVSAKQVAGGAPRGAEIIAEVAGGSLDSPLITPNLTLMQFRNVTNAVVGFAEQRGLRPEKGQKVSDFIIEKVANGDVPMDDLLAFMEREGIPEPKSVLLDAFADLRTLGGRSLNVLSQAMRRLQGASDLTPAQSKTLSFLRELDLVRREAMLLQVATTARNVGSQFARVGVEGLSEAVEQSLTRQTNRFGLTKLPTSDSVFEGLGRYVRLLGQPGTNKDVVARLLENRPSIERTVFGSFSSDIPVTAGPVRTGLGKIRGGVEFLLTPMKLSEFYFRRVGFLAKIEQRLQQRGVTTPIERVPVAEITKEDLLVGARHGLELTFANPDALGQTAKQFNELVVKLPFLGTLPLPYPRFLSNAVRYLWDFSPASGVARGYKLLTQAERGAISQGDIQVISRSLVGTAQLGLAIAIRKAGYTDETAPYRLRVGNQTIDTRPFGPFSAYLTLAALTEIPEAHVKRWLTGQGDLPRLSGRDVLTGILSTNFRTGIGLSLVDRLFDTLSGFGGEATATSFARSGKALAGDVVAQFLTGLRTIKDVFGTFNPGERIQRERKLEPFLGPIKEAIPGVSQTLPPRPSATRALPVGAEEGSLPALRGIIRQTTGVSLSRETPVERELARLGFTFRDVLPPQTPPELDFRVRQQLGPALESALGQVFKSPDFQRAPKEQQTAAILELISALRTGARARAKQQLSPAAIRELTLRTVPRLLRPSIERRLPEQVQ